MPADAEGRFAYLIEFAEPELLRHPARGAGRPDLQSAEMQSARRALIDTQAQHVDTISARLGRSVKPTHHYLATENGIAARLSAPPLPICPASSASNGHANTSSRPTVAPS